MGFPSQVNVVQAPAVEGDFASSNDHVSVVAGAGAFVAGANGVTVGRFAWADANGLVSNTGIGIPSGFVARRQDGLITTFLADSTMGIPAGLPVSLYSGFDFWVKNNGSTTSAIGNKVYANYTTGVATFAATGTPPTSGSATAATLQHIVSASTGGALPTTNTCTASISGTTMTVTAVGAGSVLGAGQTLTGTGMDASAVTSIVAQVSGTAGGIGVYTVSLSQTVTSTTITMSGGGLTLTGGNTTGVFAPGMVISGTNIPTGTTILGYGTATAGGAGTYYVDRPATTAATASTITATNASLLTVAGTVTGTFYLNDLLSGSGVDAAQYIVANGTTNANLTGLGGAGTYLTNKEQASELTAQTIGVYIGVETKWTATSVGAPGELVKIAGFV